MDAPSSPPAKRPASPARRKNLILFGAKVVVAAVLIGWLVRSGNLDVGALRIVVDRPLLLVLDLGLFSYGVVVGSFRFRALLRTVAIEVPLLLLVRLQLTALFFNVVIPGNIGGDVLKAIYVARDAPAEKKTSIFLLVFVERLLGVSALILMGALTAAVRLPFLWERPLLRPLALTVIALGAAVLVGGVLSLVLVRVAGPRLDHYTTGSSKLAKLLNQLVAALRLLSGAPRGPLTAFVISLSIHASGIGVFTVFTQAILESDVSYSAVATVFPIGLLSLVLPISPSGLGVGHVAFKRLFETIGIAGGATVFNVYLLGQIVPSLLGVFPFLSLKRRGDLPTAEEASG